MAYGSPERIEDVPAYLSGIYEGGRVPDYATEENMKKYTMFGGKSPSSGIVKKLVERLDSELSHLEIPVYIANKHWHPTIEKTVESLSDGGVEEIIAIPLFPFPSENVKNSYLGPLASSVKQHGNKMKVSFINGFSERKEFAETWSEIIRENSAVDRESMVIFSAHSLPLFRGEEREYIDSYVASVRKIADSCGLSSSIYGFQSRGNYGDRWLEPSLYNLFEGASSEGISDILAVPLGFCYEHLEILYDLDTEFGGFVKEHGIRYRRTGLPDYRDSWVNMFKNLVIERIGV